MTEDLVPQRNRVAERRLRQWCVVLSLLVICVGFAFGGDELRLLGRYERVAIEHGQYWRLVTAHLVHLGWGHVWPNLAALLIMGSLFEGVLGNGDWLVAGLTSAITIDIGLYLLDTHVQWYVGLSGVLHGILAAGALTLLLRRQAFGGVLAIGLGAKLIWEQGFGPVPLTASAVGGPVIVAAHLYGAAGGLVGATIAHLVRRSRSQL